MIETFVCLVILGIISSGVYALMSMGLSLIIGVLGKVNATHGQLVTLGAYTAFIVSSFVPSHLYLYILIAALAIGPVGILIDKVVLRPFRSRGQDLSKGGVDIIVTVGIGMVISNLVLMIFGARYRDVPEVFTGFIKIGYLGINMQRVMSLVVSIIVIALLFLFLKKTKIGTAIRAVSQNAISAQTLGINIENIYSLTWFIAAAMAGLAGALIAPISNISPAIGEFYLIKTFTIVVVGGLGNIHGALFASFILGISESVSQFWLPSEFKTVVSFTIMFLMLLFRPSGIFGIRIGREKAA
jgi:branched-chain amino acid transport system permease protein